MVEFPPYFSACDTAFYVINSSYINIKMTIIARCLYCV